MTATSYLGKPTSRVDGRAKVTGTAKYAAEYNVADVAQASWSHPPSPRAGSSASMPRMRLRSRACSTCSRTSIGPSSPRRTKSIRTRSRRAGSPFRPLYDDQIHFNGQPVALVVAEEFEIARFAASLVRIEYEQETHVTDFEAQRERAKVSKQDGAPPSTRAAMPQRRLSGRPCGSKPNTACRSSTTIRWRHSQRRRSGKATTGSPSSTRRRDRRTAGTMSPTCWRCRATRCACCRLLSAGHSDPACARNTSCRSPCWRRARSSARCG